MGAIARWQRRVDGKWWKSENPGLKDMASYQRSWVEWLHCWKIRSPVKDLFVTLAYKRDKSTDTSTKKIHKQLECFILMMTNTKGDLNFRRSLSGFSSLWYWFSLGLGSRFDLCSGCWLWLGLRHSFFGFPSHSLQKWHWAKQRGKMRKLPSWQRLSWRGFFLGCWFVRNRGVLCSHSKFFDRNLFGSSGFLGGCSYSFNCLCFRSGGQGFGFEGSTSGPSGHRFSGGRFGSGGLRLGSYGLWGKSFGSRDCVLKCEVIFIVDKGDKGLPLW